MNVALEASRAQYSSDPHRSPSFGNANARADNDHWATFEGTIAHFPNEFEWVKSLWLVA